ncbi:hypothetical protein TNCV_1536231 [Trichonephila clavipes]|nr:hypothetical protein TNCV_1536231 [Trichonephila clavipes]
MQTYPVTTWSRRLSKEKALWTLHAESKLYRLSYKAWKRHGPTETFSTYVGSFRSNEDSNIYPKSSAQILTIWNLLAQAVLDGCYGEKWSDTVFQVPDACPICLSPIHWPENTQCGHVFHFRCLLQHLDVSNTCPFCRAPIPLKASKIPC